MEMVGTLLTIRFSETHKRSTAGTIFSPELIAQGQDGGHTAAKILAESVRQDFSSKYKLEDFKLGLYAFYNKRGLVEALGRAGYWAAKQKFDEFAFGFNQAAERFVMVDVGSGKEAADAKIKVHLEDNIRLPQTSKILFGGELLMRRSRQCSYELRPGCHDNGYATTLRSLITAGFQDKLVLLQGYAESAVGIDELGLPSMTIPQLFISDKLGISHTASLPALRHSRSRSGSFAEAVPQGSRSTTPLPPSSLQASCTYIEDAVVSAPPGQILDSESDPLPFAPEAIMVARPTAPPSYKSALQALQTSQSRANTPELDAADSSSSSDTSDEPPTDPRASPPLTRPRHINPNIVEYIHTTPDLLYIDRSIFDRHYRSRNPLHVHYFISPTANTGSIVNMATIIFCRMNIMKRSARMRRRHLVLRRIEVR